jgi:hypothetical protein
MRKSFRLFLFLFPASKAKSRAGGSAGQIVIEGRVKHWPALATRHPPLVTYIFISEKET